MAKFKFRLQAVLNLKEKVEELRKNEFGKAQAMLEAEKQKKAMLVKDMDDAVHGFKQSITKGIDPLNIKRYNYFIENTKNKILKQEKEIEKARQLAEEKQAQLVEAMRDKKTLDILKENDFEEHIIEEKQSEQKIIDEIVSYRGSKNR